MEDNYQSILKGKIKILYQLEKWQDVVKLCEQYNEKYGKDVEIDMLRFKTERRLGRAAPAKEDKALVTTPESSESLIIPETAVEEESPLLLTADQETVQNQAMLVINETPAADQPQPVEEKQEYDPFPQANELIITDPFAENEPGFSLAINEPPPAANALLITEPFAEKEPVDSQAQNEPPSAANALIITEPFVENEPVASQIHTEPPAVANAMIITDPFVENEPLFSLANNEPPVILIDNGKAENVPIQTESQTEEMVSAEESSSEFESSKSAFDSKSNPAMAFDTEPILTPAPQGESFAMPKNTEEEKFSAEPFAATADAKPQPLGEPDNIYSKKIRSPKKIAFNFKYFLVLILPLAAAIILWLALSGKINLNGGPPAKVSPASADEPQVPAVQRPVQKVTPALQIPQIDEKEKLVNEKISQANDFIKNGDILNALTVVLEAKKIKNTEALHLLEQVITKKMQEDEVRTAEQKQAAQSMEQSEDQAYTKAETENTLASWQNFLLLYPQGEFTARARNKIVSLEKKAAQKAEQELQLKIQQAQKLKLRSDYMDLSQAELNAALQRLAKPIVQFEKFEHGGEKVVIDFSSGLMWTLWNKPMVFDKAKWWANRIYAGYSGWRLPTVEESLSLLQMDPTLYAGLADFAVWTGDVVGDQVRSIWTLKVPQGQFIPQDYSQVYYVWAVRKASR